MVKLILGFLILVISIGAFLFFSKHAKSQDGFIKGTSKRFITSGFIVAIAEAIIARGEADAKALLAQGEAYKQNPELIKLKIAEIEAEVNGKWANNWSGYSFEGMTGFSFADLTEVLKGIIPRVQPSTAN